MAGRSYKHHTLDAVPRGINVECLGENITSRARRQGYKFFVQGYIHGIGFEESDAGETVATARCYRSMRKNEKPHRLALRFKEDSGRKIIGQCSCTAGLSGKCSHVVGLIQALMHFQQWGMKDVPADMSCTQLQQLWGRPRGAKIQPESVLTVAVTKPKEGAQCRRRKLLKHLASAERVEPVSDETIQALISHKNTPLAFLLTPGLPLEETQVGQVQAGSSLPDQLQKIEEIQRPSEVSVCPCGDLEFPLKAICQVTKEYEDCNNIAPLGKEQAEELERKTASQASCKLWHEARKNRITASNFSRVFKRQKEFDEKFVNSIMEGAQFSSFATSYGKAHETFAKELYTQKMPQVHIHDCGLVVNPAYSFLGATPDGKVCDSGMTGILEIQCPFKARYLTIRETVSLYKDFCLTEKDGEFVLKMEHNYMCQVQGQLMITGAAFCDFVIYTKADIHIERIEPNVDFQKSMLFNLSAFFKTYCLPYIKKLTQ